MRSKPACMNAGIGATAAKRFNGFAKQHLQGIVELRLNGVRIFLKLPAVIGCAFVRYVNEILDLVEN